MELKRNRRAYTDYQHLETLTAGIALTGPEVKSAKAGLIQLDGSYVRMRGGEAWLVGAQIAPYPKAGYAQTHYTPDRTRKLLLTRQELHRLVGKLSMKGLTVVPLFVYSTKRLVKVKIAVAKGKRKFDKRAAIKERELRRQIQVRLRRS